jgi:3-oxoacyl-[acyl-carrier-protein] synthase II
VSARAPLAVTGYGCVTPLGRGAAALFDGWRDRRCAIRPVRRFDTSSLSVHLGGEMPDAADAGGLRGAAHLRAALDEAMAASRLPRGARVVVLVATTKGFLESGRQVEERHPAHDVALPARFVATELRTRFGAETVAALTVSTACASGLTALALALDEMGRDDAPDAVVCAGVDLLSDFVYRGFAALSAVDAELCRPFDVLRAGMSASEAAAAMVLEPEARALARGAKVRGRILGAGLANDATHPTAPSRDGGGMALAIAGALASAGISAGELGHVHAHGTGTVFNDAMEVRALAGALGAALPRIPVTALKGSIGHTFGPSGLVETIASFEAVRARTLPAVTGLARPEGGLDLVTAARRLEEPRFLKTSAGFGGFDAAVVAEGVPS